MRSTDPRITAGALESSLDPDDPDNSYNRHAVAYFCRLEPDRGLRLGFDPTSYVLSKNTDWEALRRYMSGGGAAMHQGQESSLRRRTSSSGSRAWIRSWNPAPTPRRFSHGWGLAAGYVKQRLYEANEGSADAAQRTAALVLGQGAAAEITRG